jgi:hypothetical protein
MARQRPINALVVIRYFLKAEWTVCRLGSWTGVKATHAESGGRWVILPAKNRPLTHSELHGIRTKVRSFGMSPPV